MKAIVPYLWFSENNCEEAVNYYLSVFPNSEILSKELYPPAHLDPHFEEMQGKILNLEFMLNGQKFAGIDGGPTFQFTEAISFLIECEHQAEIDYYWSKLSHVEEAEACGWVKDRFGISWQIVPENIADLMQTEAQVTALMGMKKIIIQELIDAAT